MKLPTFISFSRVIRNFGVLVNGIQTLTIKHFQVWYLTVQNEGAQLCNSHPISFPGNKLNGLHDYRWIYSGRRSWEDLDFSRTESKNCLKIKYWTQPWRHRSCRKARERSGPSRIPMTQICVISDAYFPIHRRLPLNRIVRILIFLPWPSPSDGDRLSQQSNFESTACCLVNVRDRDLSFISSVFEEFCTVLPSRNDCVFHSDSVTFRQLNDAILSDRANGSEWQRFPSRPSGNLECDSNDFRSFTVSVLLWSNPPQRHKSSMTTFVIGNKIDEWRILSSRKMWKSIFCWQMLRL
jgi:hypothetical protein